MDREYKLKEKDYNNITNDKNILTIWQTKIIIKKEDKNYKRTNTKRK